MCGAGIELSTPFTVTCSGFAASLPTSNLYYRVAYVQHNTSREIAISDLLAAPTKTTLLPQGLPLTVAVYAIDEYGTASRASVTATVTKAGSATGGGAAAPVIPRRV